MSEAVRTMASPAATWVIVVVATCLALFMATAAMFTDLRVAREQRRERKLGIAPEAGSPLAMAAGSQWPRLSQALLAEAGVEPLAAAQIRSGVPADATAAGHEIPAQRGAPARQPEPAVQGAQAAPYAATPEPEPPTVPIPAQRAQTAPGPQETAQGTQESQYASGGRPGRGADGSAGETTRPDLPAQPPPGQRTVAMPAQRSGESDRAERSFAGPAPQDDDEDEQ